MSIYLYKLKPLSSFHIGRGIAGGIDSQASDDIIHSDTLFSSIISVWSLLYGNESIKDFFDSSNPKFIISSAFHYYKDILFFPKLIDEYCEDIIEEKDGKLSGKAIKKLKYISYALLRKLAGRDYKLKSDDIYIYDKKYSLLNEEKPKIDKTEFILKSVTRERNSQPRFLLEESEKNLFSVEEIFFNKNAGFYFFVQFIDETIKEKFRAVINCLGDEGLGGERSYGKGNFKIIEEREITDELKMGSNNNKFLTLSLYLPDNNELPKVLNNSKYDFELRKGWISQTRYKSLRKKGVRMFKEGSQFSLIDGKKIYGKIVDVTPDNCNLQNKIYRNGLAFIIEF